MTRDLHEDSVVLAQVDNAAGKLDNETIVLGSKASSYVGLTGVGSRIWDLIQQPRSSREIINTLCEEHEVDRERCRDDVLDFLSGMIREGLVVICDDQSS